MKLTLPENISEVTLGQYQTYMALLQNEGLAELDFKRQKVEVFTGIPADDLTGIKKKDLTEILDHIDKALETGVKFQNRIMIGEMEFGFIPNLDNITMAEFVDLQKYNTEIENLHRTMAILFRPILNKDRFDNYSIEPYEGTKEYAEAMKGISLQAVNGALGFFYHLAKELRLHIQTSTMEVQAKVRRLESILTDGNGMQQ